MTNIEENEKCLRGSLDYAICKKAVLASGIGLAAAAALFILLSLAAHSFRFMLALIPTALYCVPSAAINGYRMRQILKCWDSVSFYESVLTDPQPYPGSGVTFTVTWQDSGGRRMEAQTHAIAQTRGLLRPNFSVLNGKKVLLAYHEPTERGFVIRILSENQYYPY